MFAPAEWGAEHRPAKRRVQLSPGSLQADDVVAGAVDAQVRLHGSRIRCVAANGGFQVSAITGRWDTPGTGTGEASRLTGGIFELRPGDLELARGGEAVQNGEVVEA